MPRDRGSRQTIAPYVYQDDVGLEAVAYVPGRRPKSKRFAHGTALATIDRWQRATKRQIAKEAASLQVVSTHGTFGAIITDYLTTIVNPKARTKIASEIRPWLEAVGAVSLKRLATAESRRLLGLELRRIQNGWLDEGTSASLVTHRRRAFAKAWDAALPDEQNLVRKLPRPRQPKGEVRGFDMAALEAIIDLIPDTWPGAKKGDRNLNKACLRVMLWTGLPPATQDRLGAFDVDLEGATVRLPPREKGEGAEAVVIPLFAQGVEAFRAWLRAFAFQRTIKKRPIYRSFRGAFARYRKREAADGRTIALPDDLRPYDLRHSFLTWAALQPGMDTDMLQLLGQHASLETTMRYIRAARARRAATVVWGQKGAKGFWSRKGRPESAIGSRGHDLDVRNGPDS